MKKKILAAVMAAVMLVGTAALVKNKTELGTNTGNKVVAFDVTTNGTGNPDDPPPM